MRLYYCDHPSYVILVMVVLYEFNLGFNSNREIHVWFKFAYTPCLSTWREWKLPFQLSYLCCFSFHNFISVWNVLPQKYQSLNFIRSMDLCIWVYKKSYCHQSFPKDFWLVSIAWSPTFVWEMSIRSFNSVYKLEKHNFKIL